MKVGILIMKMVNYILLLTSKEAELAIARWVHPYPKPLQLRTDQPWVCATTGF